MKKESKTYNCKALAYCIMNGLMITVKASCMFHKDYFTFYNQNWNLNLGTNFGKTYGTCSIKLLPDIIVKIRILEVSNINFRAILILELI